MTANDGIGNEQGVVRIDSAAADRVCGAANVLIAGGWLWLHWPVVTWLARMLGREDTRLNLGLLVVAVVVLGAGAVRRSGASGVRISVPPAATSPAILLTITSALTYVAIEYLWAVHILSAVLFGLGTYGLISLYYPNRRLPVALLLIAVLPFGAYLDVYVGFPMRLLTARVIEQLLTALHVASASAETILVLENGIAHIDLPCSGVQSLWTGLLFFLAATCCERPALGLRWAAVGVLCACALLTANALRVAVLIGLTLVLHLPRVAEVLHVPLGILSFIGCCALTLALLRRRHQHSPVGVARARRPIAPARVQVGALAAIAVLGLLYRPAPLPALHAVPFMITLPPAFLSEVEALTDEETDFFSRHGPVHAERRRFQWQNHSGSLLLAFSPAWRGHHNPEHCLAGNGVKVGVRRTVLVGADFPVRAVALDDGAGTAVYWFQSPSRTTDEIASRIWADFTGAERRWMLVSIVFDAVEDPGATQTQQLLTLIHAAVAAALKGAST